MGIVFARFRARESLVGREDFAYSRVRARERYIFISQRDYYTSRRRDRFCITRGTWEIRQANNTTHLKSAFTSAGRDEFLAVSVAHISLLDLLVQRNTNHDANGKCPTKWVKLVGIRGSPLCHVHVCVCMYVHVFVASCPISCRIARSFTLATIFVFPAGKRTYRTLHRCFPS